MVLGKVALVTGGGGAIGKATCQTLAQQGARVVVADLDSGSAEATLSTLTGSGHWSIQLDVTCAESVENVFRAVIDKYKGPPTVVINCAGVLLCSPFLEETLDMYQRTMDVNLKGTFLMMQTACRELKAAEVNGSIVNISSTACNGSVLLASYSASKAAVIALTKAVVKELGSIGIRANVVCPGPTDTTLLDPLPPGYLDMFRKLCPAKRLGTPQEVADLMVFLASEKSTYINGTSIHISGGFS